MNAGLIWLAGLAVLGAVLALVNGWWIRRGEREMAARAVRNDEREQRIQAHLDAAKVLLESMLDGGFDPLRAVAADITVLSDRHRDQAMIWLAIQEKRKSAK